MANLKLQTSVALGVTPNDTLNIAYPGDSTDAPNKSAWPCVLYVGGAGNLTVLPAGNTAPVTLVGVAAGTFIPIQVVRVYSTSTTASSILALW